MGESKHTPGPWVICGYGTGWLVAAPSADTMGIAYVVGRTEVKANARLIAAAPDLLSIVKQFIALPSAAWHPERHAAEEAALMQAARAAIAKAEGRSDA